MTMRVQWAVVLLLLVLVFYSAIQVVLAKHQSRVLFQTLIELEAQSDDLRIEWGQLQLEQQTLATHGTIETEASRRLDMHVPGNKDIILVHRQ